MPQTVIGAVDLVPHDKAEKAGSAGGGTQQGSAQQGSAGGGAQQGKDGSAAGGAQQGSAGSVAQQGSAGGGVARQGKDGSKSRSGKGGKAKEEGSKDISPQIAREASSFLPSWRSTLLGGIGERAFSCICVPVMQHTSGSVLAMQHTGGSVLAMQHTGGNVLAMQHTGGSVLAMQHTSGSVLAMQHTSGRKISVRQVALPCRLCIRLSYVCRSNYKKVLAKMASKLYTTAVLCCDVLCCAVMCCAVLYISRMGARASPPPWPSCAFQPLYTTSYLSTTLVSASTS